MRSSRVDDPIKSAAQAEAGIGPVRTRRQRRNARAERVKKTPKTAEDLDKELDAFMHVDDSADVQMTT